MFAGSRTRGTVASTLAVMALGICGTGCSEEDVRNAAKDVKEAGEHAIEHPKEAANDVENGLNSAKRKIERAGRDARRELDRHGGG